MLSVLIVYNTMHRRSASPLADRPTALVCFCTCQSLSLPLFLPPRFLLVSVSWSIGLCRTTPWTCTNHRLLLLWRLAPRYFAYYKIVHHGGNGETKNTMSSRGE